MRSRSTAAQVLPVVRATGTVAARAEASRVTAARRGASMVSKDVCRFLGFSGTIVTSKERKGGR